MSATFSFYDVLGLEPTASQSDIRTAYHAAVKKYHPDVNAAPNAQRLTEMLNEAYSVLSDPEQRSEYDRALVSGKAPSESGESQAVAFDLFTCDRCGKVDPHLRFATFFRVWSIVFFTSMKGVGGVLCPPCRSHFATTTALFSGFLGAWGLPWGIFYTIRALAASIRGGEMKRLENGQLLRHLGIAFAQRGYFGESRTAFTDSLEFEKNPAVNETLKSSEFINASLLKRPGWLHGQTIGLASLAIPFIIICLFGTLSASGDKSTSASTTRSAAVSSSDDSASAPAPSETREPCLDPKTTLKGLALYKECAQTRIDLHNYLAKATTSTDIDEYKYLGAVAEFNQAFAAADAGRSDGKALANESIAMFTSLKDSATEPRVKKFAQEYYNCYVLKKCK